MTIPNLEPDPRSLIDRFSGAMREGLLGGRAKKPATKKAGYGLAGKKAAKAEDELEQLGILSVSVKSTPAEMEDFVDRLWHALDDELELNKKEWDLHLLYCANEQALAYHRDRRTWIPRRTLPWRIRSIYNVTQKAVNIRVARLVGNKPMVSVQAQSADVDDVERAEYKETLFWYLWERLYLQMKWTMGRRWAAKCGSAFLKAGFDPDAGAPSPATQKRLKFVDVMQPDPTTGIPTPAKVYAGLEEYFVDEQGNDLGPCLIDQPDELDPTGATKQVRAEIPEGAQWLGEGEATVTVRSPFNVRFDKYAETIRDSWYIQDGEILPLSKIAAMHPDKIQELREARTANEDEKALRWRGLTPQLLDVASSAYAKNSDGQASHVALDRELFYLETWIFPKNQLLKRLWGEKGCRVVTVGGVEIARTALPEWALKACPFIQIIDTLEEGNGYHKSFLRDLIPLQDDINRSRSMRAERIGLMSRLLLWAPANHGANVKALGGMNGVLVTTRSQAHKPEALNLGTGDPGIREFEQDSIAAAADLGNMNDASTGKLPSAGLAAKAIYALQYADEQSITEASALQDTALKQLAEALDQITRHEYTAARKVRLVGDDRAFMVEHEISPEDLKADVDYTFVPGSMLSRQKEAVKNEMMQLLQMGLVDPATVKKHLSTAVPDVFRSSYTLQEAKAKRTLQRILRASGPINVQPAPFDDPAIACGVLEEFALTAKWDLIAPEKQQQVMQLWQAYKVQQQMAAQQAAAAAANAAPAAPGGPPGAPKPGAQGGGAPLLGAAEKPHEAAAGAEQLEDEAVKAKTPPG
ncbi:MAG: hypothetical protein ACJ768_19675 [Gaiellaceae bacterium]